MEWKVPETQFTVLNSQIVLSSQPTLCSHKLTDLLFVRSKVGPPKEKESDWAKEGLNSAFPGKSLPLLATSVN